MGVTTYYDAFGQRTTVLLNMDGNYRYTSYHHDDAGNLARLTHPDGAAFGYAYDALGRMVAALDNPAKARRNMTITIAMYLRAAGDRDDAS